MMILNLIKEIAKFQKVRPVPEREVLDIVRELMKMRALLANISPEDYRCVSLTMIKPLQHRHNILNVIFEFFDNKLIVVLQLPVPCRDDVQLEPIYIQKHVIFLVPLDLTQHPLY